MVRVVGAVARRQGHRFEIAALIERIDPAAARVDVAVVVHVRVAEVAQTVPVRVALVGVRFVGAIVVLGQDAIVVVVGIDLGINS